MLKKHGYEVVTVQNGEKAIETVHNDPEISLILMDIDLGSGIDGTEAAGRILEKHNLPIAFLSSHTEPEVVERTEGITSYGYIVKNSGETVILASIRIALRLYESERRFQRVLSHASELSVHGYRADGTTIFWNDASEIIYGFSADEARGRKLWDLIIPTEMISDVKNAVHRMVTTGKPNPAETLALKHKNGHRVLVRSNHSVIYDSSGKPQLFCLDIPLTEGSEASDLVAAILVSSPVNCAFI